MNHFFLTKNIWSFLSFLKSTNKIKILIYNFRLIFQINLIMDDNLNDCYRECQELIEKED